MLRESPFTNCWSGARSVGFHRARLAGLRFFPGEHLSHYNTAYLGWQSCFIHGLPVIRPDYHSDPVVELSPRHSLKSGTGS